MLQRRTILSGVCCAVIGIASSALAQRPAQPIARPPRQRLGAPGLPGHFDSGGVASGAVPGVFVVVAVDTQADTLQLRDEGGRTGLVHVNADVLDLQSLKPGDEVEVDFMVPEPGQTRLEAGGLWKVQR